MLALLVVGNALMKWDSLANERHNSTSLSQQTSEARQRTNARLRVALVV